MIQEELCTLQPDPIGENINFMHLKKCIKLSDSGFSIIESLIAIVVLGIVMTGGMAFYYNAQKLYNRTLHAQLATWIADSRMEDIKSTTGCSDVNMPTDGLNGSSVSIGGITGIRKITWPTAAIPDPCSNTAPTIKDCTGPSPIPVGVCVTWTEPGESSSRNVKLETYVGA